MRRNEKGLKVTETFRITAAPPPIRAMLDRPLAGLLRQRGGNRGLLAAKKLDSSRYK